MIVSRGTWSYFLSRKFLPDADLWRHSCRFTALLEIVTYFGSQFVNQMLTHFHEITEVKHHMTIPYSKEENGIVERVNKRCNRYKTNIIFDKGVNNNWLKLSI